MPNQTTDFIPYLFLAAMIIISGLVAFVADGMGRKIGKKRLSFMGLRPRYTATLITVAAGSGMLHCSSVPGGGRYSNPRSAKETQRLSPTTR